MKEFLHAAEIAIRPAVILFMGGNRPATRGVPLTLAATWGASRWLGRGSGAAALRRVP